MSPRTRHVDATCALSGHSDLIPRRVHADGELGPERCHQPRDLPISTPDVQNPFESGQLCCSQGKDLFLVFGVGPMSEPFDPPGCMVFPETVCFGSCHESTLDGTTVPEVPSSPDFSLWPSPEREWSELLGLAEYADARDWRTLWYADHFMPNTGDESIVDGLVHECWSVIAALTAITQRVRVGSLVSPTTIRHPAILASTASTIDCIGLGRLVLGIGAGWQINEHKAYGFDMFANRARVDRFEEAIVIIRSLLTNDRTTFDGPHFQIVDAPCQPRPVQTPLPILVGTGGPRMSRLAATHADEWNTWGTPEEAATRRVAIAAACDDIGRDPATLRTSVQGLIFLVDDASTAARIAERAPADRSIIGDAHVIAAAFAAYHQAGFDEIIVPDFTLGSSPQQRLEAFQRLEEEVISLV